MFGRGETIGRREKDPKRLEESSQERLWWIF